MPWFWEDCLMCELLWLAIPRMIAMCVLSDCSLGWKYLKAGACSCVPECKQVKREEKYCQPERCPAVSSERVEVQYKKKDWFNQSIGCRAGRWAFASLDVEMMFIHGDLHLECTCYLENCQVGKHCPSCFFYMHLHHSEVLNFLWNASKIFLCIESMFWVFEDSKSRLLWIRSLLALVLFETWTFKLLTHTAVSLKEMAVL